MASFLVVIYIHTHTHKRLERKGGHLERTEVEAGIQSLIYFLSFFHLGKALITLDFTVRLLF